MNILHLIQTGQEYARQREGEFLVNEPLGHGVHGSVFAFRPKAGPAMTAVKIHQRSEGYLRERDAYLRLRSLGISTLCGHAVPILENQSNWPQADFILAELRRYGIYVADVNPGNIGFVEGHDSQ